MKHLALCIILLVIQAPLVLAQTCQDEERMLKWVQTADPVRDAENALKDGNTKLMAVYGYTLIFPGTESYQDANNAYIKGNYITIEGAGDDLCSEEHARLNNIAYEYAELYNKTILGIK